LSVPGQGRIAIIVIEEAISTHIAMMIMPVKRPETCPVPAQFMKNVFMEYPFHGIRSQKTQWNTDHVALLSLFSEHLVTHYLGNALFGPNSMTQMPEKAAENLITGSLTTRRLIFVHLTP
jgi:hypothetical protein